MRVVLALALIQSPGCFAANLAGQRFQLRSLGFVGCRLGRDVEF
jgi:hypothetical protein